MFLSSQHRDRRIPGLAKLGRPRSKWDTLSQNPSRYWRIRAQIDAWVLHAHSSSYMHLYLNTHTYTHKHIYSYTYIHIHKHIHTHRYANTQTHTLTHITNTHKHTYTHIHKHIYTHTYIHTHTHTAYIYTHALHTFTHTHTHTRINRQINEGTCYHNQQTKLAPRIHSERTNPHKLSSDFHKRHSTHTCSHTYTRTHTIHSHDKWRIFLIPQPLLVISYLTFYLRPCISAQSQWVLPAMEAPSETGNNMLEGHEQR